MKLRRNSTYVCADHQFANAQCVSDIASRGDIAQSYFVPEIQHFPTDFYFLSFFFFLFVLFFTHLRRHTHVIHAYTRTTNKSAFWNKFITRCCESRNLHTDYRHEIVSVVLCSSTRTFNQSPSLPCLDNIHVHVVVPPQSVLSGHLWVYTTAFLNSFFPSSAEALAPWQSIYRNNLRKIIISLYLFH